MHSNRMRTLRSSSRLWGGRGCLLRHPQQTLPGQTPPGQTPPGQTPPEQTPPWEDTPGQTPAPSGQTPQLSPGCGPRHPLPL